MKVQASKIRYIGTREEQQDTVNVFQSQDRAGRTRIIAVLTDGIGGLAHGGEASAFVNRFVSDALAAACENVPAEEAGLTETLVEVVHAANAALGRYKEDNGIGDCGTTFLAVIVVDGFMHYASVGDSLLYVVDRDARLLRFNEEHVETVDGRTGLSAAVMGTAVRHIDSGICDLEKSGFTHLLLASDGLRSLSAAEIVRSLFDGTEKKLRDIVNKVIALDLPKQDNLSMILLELDV